MRFHNSERQTKHHSLKRLPSEPLGRSTELPHLGVGGGMIVIEGSDSTRFALRHARDDLKLSTQHPYLQTVKYLLTEDLWEVRLSFKPLFRPSCVPRKDETAQGITILGSAHSSLATFPQPPCPFHLGQFTCFRTSRPSSYHHRLS